MVQVTLQSFLFHYHGSFDGYCELHTPNKLCAWTGNEKEVHILSLVCGFSANRNRNTIKIWYLELSTHFPPVT